MSLSCSCGANIPDKDQNPLNADAFIPVAHAFSGHRVQTDNSDYEQFLRSKIVSANDDGIDVAASEINPMLKPHQRDIVRWAVRKGRAAIFAAFGLGKTFMQLEIARLIMKHQGGRFLIVAPLGVRQEFKRDADKLGIPIRFVRRIEECDETGLYLTNYETIRDGKLDPHQFIGISLDEAGILRGFGGTKTFREFMRLFEGHGRFKFVATATPSPNEFIELLAYAAFLDVMDVGAGKTRFFKRDSTKADQLTLHPHKIREFYLWLSTWSIFLQKPSDICRCLCHQEKNSKVGSLENSPSNNGDQASSETERGCAAVSAAEQNSQAQIISKLDKSSVADVCANNTDTRESAPTLSGKGCTTDVADEIIRTGQTTADVESLSVIAGHGLQISSPTWGIRPAVPPSNETTITATTSPETVVGQRGSNRRVTAAHTLSVNYCDECRCDEGYDLPEIEVHWHEVATDHAQAGYETSGQGKLIKNAAIGVSDAAREKRDSLSLRIAKLMELRVSDPTAHRLIWHDLEAERLAIEKAVPGIATVYGAQRASAQGLEQLEAAIIDFSDGEIPELAGKPAMLGSGCNFQRFCSWEIFLGIGFKFNDFIQAIHRCHRFLQEKTVRVDLIYTEAEREVRRVLERKWEQHKELTANMTEIIRQYGLARNALQQEFSRSIGVERTEERGENFVLVNNDSIIETREMEPDSVHLILTSIPFSTQYEYTPSYNDFGHSESNEQFWRQMDFLTPELLRILKPGRVAAIHVKDRIVPGGMTGLGFQTVYRFSDDCCTHFEKHGFAFLGRKTIVTDVVRENNQTYRLGWTEQCKDGSRMGYGMPEYLLLFRKPPTDLSNGYADEPVIKDKAAYTRSRWQIDAHGFARSSGDRLLTLEDLEGAPHERIFKMFRKHSLTSVYDFEEHVKLSESLERCPDCGHIHTGMKSCELCDCPKSGGRLPVTFMLLQPPSWHPDVWTDITRMLSLNSAQSASGREMHLCPLQLDIVERVLRQFSMEGETVFDPFVGLGTVAYIAVKMRRRGIGVELNPRYFTDAVGYLRRMEAQKSAPTLFDLMEVEGSNEKVLDAGM